MARYRYYGRRRRLLRIVAAVVAGVVCVAAARGHEHSTPTATAAAASSSSGTVAPSPAAAQAISFARAQLGKPYVWGGTGPPLYSGFDCSGLVMMAYQSAGVSIPRTSEDQWAYLPHVDPADVEPGDLVFFPGSDGTFEAPGHVALVIGGGQMIQAYDSVTPIEISPLNGDGAGGIVGYARPS